MSILDQNSIDIINVENEQCVLIIIDHLEWNDEYEHLNLIKKKINLYIYYIESGQIYRETPGVEGKKITIKLICKFTPKPDDIVVLDKINKLLHDNYINFMYEVSSVSE